MGTLDSSTKRPKTIFLKIQFPKQMISSSKIPTNGQWITASKIVFSPRNLNIRLMSRLWWSREEGCKLRYVLGRLLFALVFLFAFQDSNEGGIVKLAFF